MKITAEFNSNEELLSFINTFGAKAIPKAEPKQGVSAPVETKKESKKEEPKSVETPKTEKPTSEPPKEELKEEPKEQAPSEEPKQEEPKVSMEMVRAVFTKLIKAGKQKEAKEITEKYGAKKLPDLKEEHYAAALKDAEELL